jgi:putative membrane protein
MLNPAEQERIERAIAQAESATSGEIYCVYERKLSGDDANPLLWASLLALLLAPFIAGAELLAFTPWSAAHATGATAYGWQLLSHYVLIQGVCFFAALAIVSLPVVRQALTPRAVKRARAHRAALQHFHARGLHQTRDRTGVLIFVVEQDRQIEVIADTGIHTKTAPEAWGEATAVLAAGLKRGQASEGFEAAIGLCGKLLAEHFPRRPDDTNELPNRIVVIE